VSPFVGSSLAQTTGHEIFDATTSLKTLLHLDEKFNTVDEVLDKVNLRLSKTVAVGDVKGATDGSCVDTTGSTLLETHLVEESIKAGILGHIRDFDVDSSTETSSKVGGAGKDVAEMLGPHELPSLLGNVVLNLLESITEALEHPLDVSSLLHGDDTGMVLLVDPDKEVLVLVVPDTTGIGPVTPHTGAQEQGRHRLVKQEVVIDELLLFSISHAIQGVVLARKFTLELTQSINNHTLNLTALSTGANWGESKTTNATSGTNTGRENVLGVKVASLDLRSIKVSGVLVPWLVTIVAILNYSIHEGFESLVALFITSHNTHGHDEWMAGVVNTSLDTLVKGAAIWSNAITELSVHSGCQVLGHHIVVLGQVRVVAAGREFQMSIR